MSDRPMEPTPWWDFDPDERPVPLNADAEWAAADDAELIVGLEREAIIREDTEPTITTLAALKTKEKSRRRTPMSVPRSAVLAAAVGLAAGCVVMFSLGWTQGAAVAADRPTSVGSTTERVDSQTSLDHSDGIKHGNRKGGGR